MNDQAEKLRQRLQKQAQEKSLQTIAVISGKGGVGKSSFSLNFAISLSERRRKVLLFDLDIGMGNVHLLAGVSPKKSIVHFFTEKCSLNEIIEKGPGGISFIAGGSGLSKIVKMEPEKINELQTELQRLMVDYDYFIFDLGAGMTEETVQFLLAIQHVFTIVTPEPTSIMDAYSAMKILILNRFPGNMYLIGNRMINEKENQETLIRLQSAVDHFLQKQIPIFGYIPEDAAVSLAARNQIPFVLYKTNCKATKHMKGIAKRFDEITIQDGKAEETKHFIQKLKSLLFRK